MKKPQLSSRIAVCALSLSLLCNVTAAARPQDLRAGSADLRGGANAVVSQDIIGGASVAFKRFNRIRDIAGGAARLGDLAGGANRIVRNVVRPIVRRASVNVQVASNRRTEQRTPRSGNRSSMISTD